MANEITALNRVGEIKAFQREAVKAGNEFVRNAVGAGRLLILSKSELPHGEWENYCEQCGIHPRTARRYMDAAKQIAQIPKSDTVSVLKMATSLDDLKEHVPKMPHQPKQDAPVQESTGSDKDGTEASTDDAVRNEESSGGAVGRPVASPPSEEADDSPQSPCATCGRSEWKQDEQGWYCGQCCDSAEEPATAPPKKATLQSEFLALWDRRTDAFAVWLEAWCRDRFGIDATPAKPRKRGTFQPPTLDEVRAYCKERGKGVDAQKWHDHYTSNGWKVGRNSMKNWKAAVRTWEGKSFGSVQASEAKARGRAAMEFVE